MSFNKKKFFCLNCLICFSLFLSIRSYLKNEAFSVHKIFKVHSVCEETIPVEVQSILKRDFHYLDKGGQSYVFEDQDSQYILKFAKRCGSIEYFWTSDLMKIFELIPYIKNKRVHYFNKQQNKAKQLLNSQEIVTTNLAEESGLVYVHHKKTLAAAPCSVTLIDKSGYASRVDLNDYNYTIQYKAEMLPQRLQAHFIKNDMRGLEADLNSIKNLINLRASLGIIDTDKKLPHNIGFIDDRAVCIDFGRYEFAENEEENTENQSLFLSLIEDLKNSLLISKEYKMVFHH